MRNPNLLSRVHVITVDSDKIEKSIEIEVYDKKLNFILWDDNISLLEIFLLSLVQWLTALFMRVLKRGEENWVAWKINNDPVITHRVSWISLIRAEQAYWFRSRVANPTCSNGLSLIDGKNLRSAIYREPRYFNSGKKKKKELKDIAYVINVSLIFVLDFVGI